MKVIPSVYEDLAFSVNTNATFIRYLGYLGGREPAMRISTSLLALCCQSGVDATLETPIRARSRSNGSRSLRISPLLIARFTRASIAPSERNYETKNAWNSVLFRYIFAT